MGKDLRRLPVVANPRVNTAVAPPDGFWASRPDSGAGLDWYPASWPLLARRHLRRRRDGAPALHGRVQGTRGAAVDLLRSPKDLVNDVRDRCTGVDQDAIFRNVFFRAMQSRNELPFHWLSAAPLRVRSLVKPPIQRVKGDFKDEHAVE